MEPLPSCEPEPPDPPALLPLTDGDCEDGEPGQAELRQVATLPVQTVDVEKCSLKDFRAKLATECGLPPEGLECRKEQVNTIIKEVVDSLDSKKESRPARAAEELGVEPQSREEFT